MATGPDWPENPTDPARFNSDPIKARSIPDVCGLIGSVYVGSGPAHIYSEIGSTR